MSEIPIADQAKLDQRLKPILQLLERFQIMDSLYERQPHSRPEVESSLLHRQQDAELSRRLLNLGGADAAQLLEILPGESRHRVWLNLGPAAAGAALLEVPGQVAEDLLAHTPESRVLDILDTVKPNQISALKGYLPASLLNRFKQHMEEQARAQLEISSSYSEDYAGGLMQYDFVLLAGDLSVAGALSELREQRPLPEQTDQIFVQDEFQRYTGSVPVAELLFADREAALTDLVQKDAITFQAEDSSNHVAQAFDRYNLVSAPVLNAVQQVQGRLTVDAVMDYRRKHTESQALASAGLREDTDLFAPVWKAARDRWSWLAINLLTAFVATRFIAVFETTLQQLVSLAVLMPIIASIGGNTGNQTIALFVRGLALDQIKRSNYRILLRKEVAIALINGVIWGGLLALVAAIGYRDPALGLVMMAAMILNLLIGALVGMGVPLLAARMGKDPAVGSSVLLTFTTDSMGFFIFLGLATLFLL